jgi:ectoine hydroxylase-related dioxygenase (phytanoyl-CoA dioxygenase family)
MGGTCAIRFPVEAEPDDAGWHVDGSFPFDGTYGLNRRSTDRALLMLVLYTPVGIDDAPTRIRVGSHHRAASVLERFGDDGCRFDAVVPLLDDLDALPLAFATGDPGDVYLCHPFLVHAAQRNRGSTVRFLSQPAVPWKAGYDLLR